MAFTRVWLDSKEHSDEGHTKLCILTFNEKVIWGPTGCHDNTIHLKEALHKADSRFDILIMDKPKTIEGHTAAISVSRGGTTYLSRLSTHPNMQGLCAAVFDAQEGRAKEIDGQEIEAKQAELQKGGTE
ncbi:hypothetical protein F5Y01DRAFT_256564 [Xylaria sp. FL0043]|nr:hypothetical protein F5Y01DRAFT_256564 [Xylaria sp. FL0043]